MFVLYAMDVLPKKSSISMSAVLPLIMKSELCSISFMLLFQNLEIYTILLATDVVHRVSAIVYQVREQQWLAVNDAFAYENIVLRELAVPALKDLEHTKSYVLYRNTAVGLPHKPHLVTLEQRFSLQAIVVDEVALAFTLYLLEFAERCIVYITYVF